MTLEEVPFPELGRTLYARPGTSDRRAIDDARTGRYHLPPEGMPVPRTVLDLGANIGATAAHYRALWPEALIVAVEMDEGNRSVLIENFEGPVLGYAVGSVNGRRSYDTSRGEEGYRLGPGKGKAVGIHLYDVLAAVGDDRVCDFVKMDVEGAEWEILSEIEGRPGERWRGLVKHLLIELHGDASSGALVARATRLLGDAGYVVERHAPHPAAVYARWPS